MHLTISPTLSGINDSRPQPPPIFISSGVSLMDLLWESFRSYMLKCRPIEFSSVIGGEQGWKECFSAVLNKKDEDWPESMRFWVRQVYNSSVR